MKILEISNKTEQTNLETQERMSNVLGNTINKAIDLGLKSILPDFLEDTVIKIKDNLIKEGLVNQIGKVIGTCTNFGKKVLTSSNNINTFIDKEGLIKDSSKLIDKAIDKIVDNGKLDENIAKIIKQGKNIITKNICKNIDTTINSQNLSVEKIKKYCRSWENYYKNENFTGMDKEYKKLNKELENTIVTEETLKKAREIENIHNLIKNNNKNFDITNEQINIAKYLI